MPERDPLADNADAALAYAVRRYTVGLGPKPEVASRFTREIPIASGVLVEMGVRTFIVTADHFLHDVRPEEMEILFAPDWGRDLIQAADTSCTNVKELLSKVVPKERSRAVPLDFIGCTREIIPHSDVAALEIPSGFVPAHCSILEYGPTHVETCTDKNRYYLNGLPSKASMLSTNRRARTANITSGWSVEPVELAPNPDPKDWGEDQDSVFDSSLHYALRPVYPPTGLPKDDAHLGFTGYSGGGLWWVPELKRQGSDFWTPNLRLCGVQSAYHKNLGLLKITRASLLESVLTNKE